jgi:hypothetical protein
MPARGQRVWLAPPLERWALLDDVSNGGLLVIAGGLRVGMTLVVRRELSSGLSEARVAIVTRTDGHRAGLRFVLDRAAELGGCADRRSALRIKTSGMVAWISGDVHTPALVRDVSATGARIEPVLPLPRLASVRAELLFGDLVIGERRARVVRSDGAEAGLRFLDCDAKVAP